MSAATLQLRKVSFESVQRHCSRLRGRGGGVMATRERSCISPGWYMYVAWGSLYELRSHSN